MATPESYSHLKLAEGQRRVVEDLAKIMAEECGLNEIVLRGFFWQSCKSWQQRSRHWTSEVAGMPPEKRLLIVEEIFEEFSRLVEETLPSNEERAAFRRASRTGFERWQEKYARGLGESEG